MTVRILDLRGLKCPLPVLKLRKALRGLPPGTRLIAECTDPLAVIDIPHLINETGDRLDRQERAGDVLAFHITRTGAGPDDAEPDLSDEHATKP